MARIVKRVDISADIYIGYVVILLAVGVPLQVTSGDFMARLLRSAYGVLSAFVLRS